MRVPYCLMLFVISCVGFVRYKQFSLPFKILTWSVFAVFLTNSVDQFLIIKYRSDSSALQVLAIEEYVFYSTVYYCLFKNEAIKKFIFISVLIMVCFFPFNAIFLQPFYNKFPTNINIPAQVLYAVFSLLMFKEMLDYPVKMNIVKQSIFWFNIAMLFYATTGFFMLGLSNYLSERPFVDKMIMIIDLWWFIDYLFHILVFVAFVTRSKENNTVNA